MSLVQNKKIHLEYTIEKKMVFGVELFGPEVKSLKNKQGNLDGGKIIVKGSEVFLLGSCIPIYQEKNNPTLDAYRIRKVLATKKEITEISTLGTGTNLYMFPISFFLQGRIIKLECGIGRRLKKQDKREVIKRKDSKRKDLE